ncbi:MAG: ethanolamine utilization microcompartment protein EutL [Clostridia bacterium]
MLSIRVIANLEPELRERLRLPAGARSIGLLTCDSDDVGYTAIDEATKKAEVSVCYATSMYAGASNASTKLAGEFLGILAGATPAEVESGLRAARHFVEHEACFYSANEDDSILYYAHCISRTGLYLSSVAGIATGAPLAYLIAPPLESVYGVDQALKAASVRVVDFYGPPSNTNFGGALLTGTQSDCMAACSAFEQAVLRIADVPIDLGEG